MRIIDTPAGIEMYRLMAMRSALGMEIRTGMKMSRGISVLQAARESGYTKKATKKGAYQDLDKLIAANGGTSRPL